jgi:hypothetical protein
MRIPYFPALQGKDKSSINALVGVWYAPCTADKRQYHWGQIEKIKKADEGEKHEKQISDHKRGIDCSYRFAPYRIRSGKRPGESHSFEIFQLFPGPARIRNAGGRVGKRG